MKEVNMKLWDQHMHSLYSKDAFFYAWQIWLYRLRLRFLTEYALPTTATLSITDTGPYRPGLLAP
jgi:hypothetical protein